MKKKIEINKYQRVHFQNTPIYIHPEKPDWFVPSKALDKFLKTAYLQNPDSNSIKQHKYFIEKFNQRFPGNHYLPYKGRKTHHTLKNLKECWFHITNRCNMSCKHCMFSSCPKEKLSINKDLLIKGIQEAINTGCKLFYFTGGEPFIYPGFTDVVDYILLNQGCKVVILTNAKNIKNFNNWLLSQDRSRLHFQVSVDGMEQNHDYIRGAGAFKQLKKSLKFLLSLNFNVTLAMAVTYKNANEMISLVEFAYSLQINNLHFMWLLKKGKSKKNSFPHSKLLFNNLLKSYEKASQNGILIDNVEIIKSQTFGIPGTRYDLNNSGWESLAVGPDGFIYPSPALISETKLKAGHLINGLENIWKNSKIFKKIRNASIFGNTHYKNHPLKFLLGGGDMDHSYISSGQLTGLDPYFEIKEKFMLYLIHKESQTFSNKISNGILCRMGEKVLNCEEGSSPNRFTHSNCVLSLAGKDGHTLINSFYSDAAKKTNEDIVNPVVYNEQLISHIPDESRFRSYGCGSPVMDTELQKGEALLDLGSGTGVECFIASKLVGKEGKVTGIDMSDAMLKVANKSRKQIENNLGYKNIFFKKGFLESLPLKNESINVIISNCVINLSPNKRKTISEVFRVLKPAGRICISDIISQDEIPLSIQYNNKLRGECLGGAMREIDLFALLEEIGFESIYIKKRFVYREIDNFKFYSITYQAYKPAKITQKKVIYKGPFTAIMTDKMKLVHRGLVTDIEVSGNQFIDSSLFYEIDENGNILNSNESSCCCAPPGQKKEKDKLKKTGCLICQNELIYFNNPEKQNCMYCEKEFESNTKCKKGHFVCDNCHIQDAETVITRLCTENKDIDLIRLFEKLHSHPCIAVHGPEHHAMIPGIVTSTYKNSGGKINDEDIITSIKRGLTVHGGSCGFLGLCGAATGVSGAFAVIIKSTPLKARERQIVQKVTHEVLGDIIKHKASRCCQRECYIALKTASRISKKYLGIKLKASKPNKCTQSDFNAECIKKKCPLY